MYSDWEVEEKPYIESLEKKRYRDMAEEEPYSSSLKGKRVKIPHADTPQELETVIHPSGRLERSPVLTKHHSTDSERIREPGAQHCLEESGAGRSDRVESAQAECQMDRKVSFFSSSSDFQVFGSNFNSFRDHITTGNIIINVNGSGKNETISVDVPEKFTSDEMRRIPQIESVEIKPSELNIKRIDLLVRKSSDIYYRHLLTLGYGSPLWIPEPSTSLPIEYQKAGIGIGDVGILKDSGGFDFLFNVYQPHNDANHPINPRTMPDGFVPLCRPEERDMNSRFEFKDFSFLASSGINSRRNEFSDVFIFESSADEGAILTMSKGANSIDLENMGLLRRYVSKNVHQWYTYANEVRGRDAGNGDLRIVIGRTSATTWGMAAFSKQSSNEDSPSCFKFKPSRRIGQNKAFSFNPNVSSPNYEWEYSGNLKAEVKSGPDDHEIEKLENLDRLQGDKGQMAYENQSLFARTINVTLQERQRGSDQPQPDWKGWVDSSPYPVLVFEDYGCGWDNPEPISLSANFIAPLNEECDDDMDFTSFLAHPTLSYYSEDQIEAGNEDYFGFGIQPEVTEESPQFSVANFLSSNHSESRSSSWPQLPTFQLADLNETHCYSSNGSDTRGNPGVPLETQSGFNTDSSGALPMPEASPTTPNSSTTQVQETPGPITSAVELSPSSIPRTCSPIPSPTRTTFSNFDPTECDQNEPEYDGMSKGSPSPLSPVLPTAIHRDGEFVQESEPLNIPLPGSPGPPDSGPPLLSHLHPSKVINEFLLDYSPEATMAITEDRDWIAVLQESDTVFPTDDVLLSRIRKKYGVGFEEGVVFLQSRNRV